MDATVGAEERAAPVGSGSAVALPLVGPELDDLGGAATALGETPLDPLQRWAWPRRAGGPWMRSPSPDVDRPYELVVIDGTLYDVSQVQQTLAPSAPVLRKVELPAADE